MKPNGLSSQLLKKSPKNGFLEVHKEGSRGLLSTAMLPGTGYLQWCVKGVIIKYLCLWGPQRPYQGVLLKGVAFP